MALLEDDFSLLLTRIVCAWQGLSLSTPTRHQPPPAPLLCRSTLLTLWIFIGFNWLCNSFVAEIVLPPKPAPVNVKVR